MSEFRLDGKTAIITGGASGIGKAIANEFVQKGAFVHIIEINKDEAQKTANEIGKNVIAHQCDVANQEEVHTIISGIIEKTPIDILVNNAGIAHIGSLENTSESDFDRIFQVNVKGVYNCMHAVVEHMKTRGGIILNMASVAGSVAVADRFSYSMSKGAVLTMTYSVAKDYLEYGIRCNSISPARVHTPFVDGFIKDNYPGNEDEMFKKLSKTQPIGRMGTPEEVASLALYLCSDAASFITGTDFPIDGGFIKLNS